MDRWKHCGKSGRFYWSKYHHWLWIGGYKAHSGKCNCSGKSVQGSTQDHRGGQEILGGTEETVLGEQTGLMEADVIIRTNQRITCKNKEFRDLSLFHFNQLFLLINNLML